MGPDQLEFDFKAGERKKEVGMALAALSRRELLEIARREAVALARELPDRLVTADDVQRRVVELIGRQLGPAAGSLFRGKDWQFTGQWRASERVSNHYRMNRIWMYIGP